MKDGGRSNQLKGVVGMEKTLPSRTRPADGSRPGWSGRLGERGLLGQDDIRVRAEHLLDADAFAA